MYRVSRRHELDGGGDEDLRDEAEDEPRDANQVLHLDLIVTQGGRALPIRVVVSVVTLKPRNLQLPLQSALTRVPEDHSHEWVGHCVQKRSGGERIGEAAPLVH